MMRLASALLVCVLLSTSVISGTFAKYVTTNKAEDTARVAKWGVTVDASGNLFGNNYAKGVIANSIPTTSITDSEISVESGDPNFKVVAPGTQSEHGLTFGIKGIPEVDTKVSASIEAKDIYLATGTYGVMQEVTVNETNFETLKTAGLYTGTPGTSYTKVTAVYDASATYYQLAYTAIVGAEGYYPVVYTWDGKPALTKVTAIANGILEKINSPTDTDSTIAGYSSTVAKNYDSNTNLDTVIDLDAESITWQWEFGSAETEIGKEVVADSDDARDTILGDLMADGEVVDVDGDTITILKVEPATGLVKKGVSGPEVGCIQTKFDIKITVEQVD